MKTKSITLILIAGLIIAVLGGCTDGESVIRINEIYTDSSSPFARNSDVLLTADVEGDVIQYRWTITAGMLREAGAHSGQAVDFPRIAVTPDGYDDIGSVLLEAGLTYEEISLDTIENPLLMKPYDVVFINSSEDIELEGGEVVLSSWVYKGGALYLSGTGAELLSALWPETVKFPKPDPYVVSTGAQGEIIQAQIHDLSCTTALGITSMGIEYQSDDWAPIIGMSASVDVLVSADVTSFLPPALIDLLPPTIQPSELPVSVEFPYGDGLVIYTSFHARENQTDSERGLLECYAAKLAAHPLTVETYGLINNAGFFHYADYAGLYSEDETASYVLQMSDIDDIYFILHAPDGVLELEIDGPGDADANVSGPAPLTSVFQDVSDGVWTISFSVLDSDGRAVLPCMLTIGTLSETLQLISDKPSAIWRTPFEPGEYWITLRILDAGFAMDEMVLIIDVE